MIIYVTFVFLCKISHRRNDAFLQYLPKKVFISNQLSIETPRYLYSLVTDMFLPFKERGKSESCLLTFRDVLSSSDSVFPFSKVYEFFIFFEPNRDKG